MDIYALHYLAIAYFYFGSANCHSNNLADGTETNKHNGNRHCTVHKIFTFHIPLEESGLHISSSDQQSQIFPFQENLNEQF